MSRRHPPAPGLLRLLPETLPFYPYREETNGPVRPLRPRRRKKRAEHPDAESAPEDEGGEASFVLDQPLLPPSDAGGGAGFTLFFFVDATNRQSLRAIPVVSRWLHYALDDDGCSRVVCVPNQPSRAEINLRDSHSDPLVQASINASVARKEHTLSMLAGTGFYHLPFLHPRRLSLLRLLGATRVPCVVVVGNASGRIVTRYGWEAIEREEGALERWIERSGMKSKKSDGTELDGAGGEEGSGPCFESPAVGEWGHGRSGLPWWFSLAFWI